MTDEPVAEGADPWADVTTSLPDPIEADLREMAKGQDEGLAKVSVGLLALVHSNDRDRRQRNIVLGVVIIGVLAVFGQGVQAHMQRNEFERVQRTAAASAVEAKVAAAEAKMLGIQIKECIGEDPNTECRRIQARNTTPVVGLIQKAIDCQGLRREGKRPEPCAGVNERTDQLEAGIDPFPPPPPTGATTTTAPPGVPDPGS